MVQCGDEALAERIAQGDERAFLDLVGRYARPLGILIRYEVDNREDAEDVLQDALVAAWIALRQGTRPANVRAWLLQIARNRVRDYYRSPQRRDRPTEECQIEEHLGTFARAATAAREVGADVVAALDEVPTHWRSIARLFYLEGLTIAEIARRHRCPEGTVKRQLFHARGHIRRTLGIATPERSKAMGVRRRGAKAQPFPLTRPPITISPSQVSPFAVECPELRWWGIVPEAGNQALSAEYYPPAWRLMRVHELRAVGPASVEGVEGVEIDVGQWDPEQGWQPAAWRMFGRLTEQRMQYLATITNEGRTAVRTFLDEGFVWAWPDMERRLADEGLFALQQDGSYVTTRAVADLAYGGCGVFDVQVGDRRFACLRVLGLEGPLESDGAVLTESYVADAGRTVLMRHFPRRGCGGSALDPEVTVTLNGETFVHWYDVLTGVACGAAD